MADYIKLIASNKKPDIIIKLMMNMKPVLFWSDRKSKPFVKAGSVFRTRMPISSGGSFLRQLHISLYKFAYNDNHEPMRTRKLLLHKREISKLIGKIKERGYTLVPLKIYFKNDKIKVLLGLGKGKNSMTSARTSKRGMSNGILPGSAKSIPHKTDIDFLHILVILTL